MLTSKKQWKKLFTETSFRLVEEGEVNGGTYFLIEKSNLKSKMAKW
jgi:hypothetical protein